MTRDEIMFAFRNGDFEALTPDDCTEIFLGILKGDTDITIDLLKQLLNDYCVEHLGVYEYEKETD